MTDQPIVYVDRSKIRPGRLEELRGAMTRLAEFVNANVPRVISYAFYLDPDEQEMTVVGVHPDSACLEYHMEVGREEFRKFADLLELVQIDVYGDVSDVVLDGAHAKARMLGTGTVHVHRFHAGFNRG